MRTGKKILIALIDLPAPRLVWLRAAEPGQRWSTERTIDWLRQAGLRAGCNFIPGTVINGLEMRQADTFDPISEASETKKSANE